MRLDRRDFWIGAVLLIGTAVLCVMVCREYQQAEPPRPPWWTFSQSCDGVEVRVNSDWSASFVPFSVGMGETYRIEMIATKDGYDDIQPEGFNFYTNPEGVNDEK